MKGFNAASNYAAHLKLHSEGSTFKCRFCDASFVRKTGRTMHENSMHSDHDRRLKCELCGQRFNAVPGLTQHMELQHQCAPVGIKVPKVLEGFTEPRRDEDLG